ncbi:hypothetical protein HKD37_07G018788 [Glycine soja]
MIIVNIYSPCEDSLKRNLWDQIRHLRNANLGGLWCIVGDLNNIRSASKRYRPNGIAKSRLDKTTFTSYYRGILDNCPILLRSSNVDWGLKPFRVLDCWFQDKKFRKVVCDWWTSHSITDWGGYMLKEKIKGLKQILKKKISRIESEINSLESDGDGRQLDDQEIQLRKKLQEDLWVTATSYESLLRQKARSKWIKEEDCNSKFFHIIVNGNRRYNSLRALHNEEERMRLDGCGSHKSPGPYGLNFKFIKEFWEVIKPEVLRFLDEFYFNSGIKWSVGSSSKVRFWEDGWLPNGILIRVNTLDSTRSQTKKNQHMRQMGSSSHGTWQWCLRWRRLLFEDEIPMRACFLEDIQHLNINE